MDALLKEFQVLGFQGVFPLGLIDHRYILIHFELEEDYLHCWLRSVWTLQGFVMRIFKWSPTFTVEAESPLALVWVSLSKLPIHLFNKGPLFSIARLIGELLKIDASTISLNRPSVKRFCVEVDVQQSLPERIWIGNTNLGFWQMVEYENLPHYCSCCTKLGHTTASCRNSSSNTAKQPPTNATTQPAASIAQLVHEDRIWVAKDKTQQPPLPPIAQQNALELRDGPQLHENLVYNPSSSGLTIAKKTP